MKNSLIASIQGLGPKISEKLLNYFITEENVITAISEARISEISSIKGIGQKLALKIVQKYHSEGSISDGIYRNEILITDDIIKIHQRVIGILQSFTQTQFIKDKFSLMYPIPASKIDIIRSRLDNYKLKISELQQIDNNILSKIKILLKKIRPFKAMSLKNKLILHRIIITDSQKEYNKLVDQDIERFSKILLVEKFNEKLLTYVNSFDLVLFITNKINDDFINQVENALILDEDWNILNLIPESIISNFTGLNYEIIQTSYELMKILKQVLKEHQGKIIFEQFNEIKIKNLDELYQNLELIDKNGMIIQGNNPEYDKYHKIINKFDGIIADQEMKINESIENEIKKSKTVLEGNQIFNLLQSVNDTNSISLNELMEFLPLNIAGIVEEILLEARETLIEKLDLDDPESSIVFELYPNDMNFPIEADNFILEKLKNQLLKREKFHKYQLLSRIAKNFSKFKQMISNVIKILFELDELLAIKSFIKECNLSYPNFINKMRGLSFESGINLFLKYEGEEVVSIDYHIGNVPLAFKPECDDRIQEHDIIILTGANSGGKTTLIQTIAQIVIMAQMGLPVAAKNVNIGPFNEIYYFSKSQGGASSGAFESSLKHFTEVIASEGIKLVLMDELEAITEPGAAAKVIGSILDMLGETQCSTTILVSHLASQILKVLKTQVRIDGIEANGIDKKGDLIVDRNPKFNHLAKSMPFFIIKKLFSTSSDSKKQEIYQKMMDYFKEI